MKKLFITLLTFITATCFSQTITITEFYYEFGDTVTINYTGSNDATDWVGLYEEGDIPNVVPSETWLYVPGTGSGTMKFPLHKSDGSPLILDDGDFHLYYLCCDVWDIFDYTNIYIGDTPPAAEITIADTNVYNSDTIHIEVSYQATPLDFAGLFSPGVIPSGSNAITSEVVPGFPTSTVDIAIPEGQTPGSYYIHLLDESTGLSLDSINILVLEHPLFSIDNNLYAAGDTIPINYTASSSNLEWFGLYPDGVLPDEQSPISLVYVSDIGSGSSSLPIPDDLTVGNYDIYFLGINGSILGDTSVSILPAAEISTAETDFFSGDIIQIDVSNLVSFLDWVGMFPQDVVPSASNASASGIFPEIPTSTAELIIPDNLNSGTYKLHLIDKSKHLSLDSIIINVTATPSFSTDLNTYMAGDIISIDYENANTSTDWFAIYTPGVVPGTGIAPKAWIYVTNSGNGSVDFIIPDSLTDGNYIVYLLSGDGEYTIYDYVEITITSIVRTIELDKSSYVVYETLYAGVTNAASTDDLVAIYKQSDDINTVDPVLSQSISTIPDETLDFLLPNSMVTGNYTAYFLCCNSTEVYDEVTFYFENTDGINQSLSELEIPVYPNPARDILFIDLKENTGEAQLVVTDIYGRILRTQIEDNTGKIITIDMSGIAKGAYMLTILFEKDRYASQMFIKK